MKKIMRKSIYLGIFLSGIAFFGSATYESHLKHATVSENPVNLEATIIKDKISTRIKKGHEIERHHLTLSYEYNSKSYERTMQVSGSYYDNEVKNNKVSLVINGNNPTKSLSSLAYQEGGAGIIEVIFGLLISLIVSIFLGSYLCDKLKLYTPEELAELDAEDDDDDKEAKA
jgi:hypothetical protein